MKRRVVLLLLLLVAGAIVNIAVAWGCASLIDPFSANQPPPPTGLHRATFAVRQVREPWRGQWGAMRYCVPGMMRLDTSFNRAKSPWGPADDGPGAQPDLGDPAQLVPRWSGLSAPSAEFLAGEREIERTLVDARGWPMLSLWHMPFEFVMIRVPDKSSRHEGRGGLALPLPAWRDPAPFSSWPSEPRTLPLRIIPIGFLGNTLLYAAALWLLLAAPFAQRRRRRLKRGLCVKCGYNLRGRSATSDACPECGAPTCFREI